MTHQVILLPQTVTPEKIAAFASLFKLDTEKAQACFARAPMLLKNNIDARSAEKFHAALSSINIEHEIKAILESSETVIAPVTSVDASATDTKNAEQNSGTEQAVSVSESKPDTQTSAPIPTQPGYQFTIEGQPDFCFLTVKIPANKTIKVEASAMATMDTHLQMKTKMGGGLKRLVSGESIFINEFTAEKMPGEIGIAPAAPGDMRHVYLNGETIYLQNSAFVAADLNVAIETKWQGFTKGFFSGESFFLIRAQGTGDLWFNSYGGIIDIDVDGDYVVDTGNIVGFTEGLEYKIKSVGGYKSLFFSGEGLVCRFSGKGKIWIQTRAVSSFAGWASFFRPVGKG